MISNMNNINADISMNGWRLEEVTSFKYLGATLCKDGTCSAKICIRIASAMEGMARLNRIWQSNTINFASKFKLYRSFVASVLPVAVKHGPCVLILRKGSRLSKQVSCHLHPPQ